MEWGLPHGALYVLPSSPQLLTTSGYTCSGEFRFQTERCLSLVFCRTSIKSRHMLSVSGPVVREGEPITACYTHAPFKPYPLPLPPPEPSSPLTGHTHALITTTANLRIKCSFHCRPQEFIASLTSYTLSHHWFFHHCTHTDVASG